MTDSPQFGFIALFLGTFVSAFLLFVGLGGVTLVFAPHIVGAFQDTPPYQKPVLPVAEDRDEEFINVESLAGKQLFPPMAEPEQVAEGNWIHIPSIGVRVPLALSPTMADADVIKTLADGAALYPNGIAPGRLGNVFIAAHSTGNPWHGKYRFAFLKINEVASGNVIHLDYAGTRYTYRVTGQETIVPTADYRVISDRPVPTVTLMACWPLWSTQKRMMTYGELVNVTKLTSVPS